MNKLLKMLDTVLTVGAVVGIVIGTATLFYMAWKVVKCD